MQQIGRDHIDSIFPPTCQNPIKHNQFALDYDLWSGSLDNNNILSVISQKRSRIGTSLLRSITFQENTLVDGLYVSLKANIKKLAIGNLDRRCFKINSFCRHDSFSSLFISKLKKPDLTPGLLTGLSCFVITGALSKLIQNNSALISAFLQRGYCLWGSLVNECQTFPQLSQMSRSTTLPRRVGRGNQHNPRISLAH